MNYYQTISTIKKNEDCSFPVLFVNEVSSDSEDGASGQLREVRKLSKGANFAIFAGKSI